jgi:hypothetical protein
MIADHPQWVGDAFAVRDGRVAVWGERTVTVYEPMFMTPSARKKF